MPTVTVNLYATFRQHIGGRPTATVSVDPGQTIEQLLNQLEVPIEQTRIIFCNHRIVDISHPLQSGETIGVFPAVGGG